MTALAAQPHHDGSARYVDDPAPALGERVGVRLRVPAGVDAEAVHVRAVTRISDRLNAEVVDSCASTNARVVPITERPVARELRERDGRERNRTK